MGKVSEYAFINAKLRARIGMLHSSKVLDDMIKAPSLVESIAVLKGTKHDHLVDVYDRTGDLQQVELALLEEEIATHKEIAGYLKGRECGFVDILLEKVEIDNLKNAVRLWYSNIVRHHQISYRASYIYKDRIVNDINYTRIINATGYADVLASVEGTPYHEVFSSFPFEKLSAKGLFSLEIALDHLWFRRLFDGIGKLSGDDRRISKEIYMVDVDLKNILLFIRYSYYYHAFSDSDLSSVMIPYGFIYDQMVAKKVFALSDPSDAVRSIVRRRYSTLLDELATVRRNDDELTSRDENAKHILMMEDNLAATRSREFTRILSGNPFSIGIILAYLFLYKDEDRRIRAILSAKYYRWDENRIREAFV